MQGPFRFVARGVCWLMLATLLPGQAAPRALPAPVEAELARAKLPRDALVAVVQEVGAHSPRFAWQADRPVNPASLMKLLTTQAALELLGPAWTWSTPVWLQGTLHNPGPQGVLEGNLVIKGSGDPKLVMERLWLLLRRVQQLGVREIRGDIVLDRSAFAAPSGSPADFDGDPLRPYNVQPDALLLNYRSLLISFTPDVQRGVAAVSVDPPLAGVRADASLPLADGPCDDWRTAAKADFADPASLRFAGSFPSSCGEKQWPLAFAEPKGYDALLLLGLWREMGGAITGSVRDGAAPLSTPSFVLNSPPLAELVRDINKFSNNTMAQQLFLTLGLMQQGSGTPQAARETLRQWAETRLGEDLARGLLIDNGSGLSRDGRASAALLARLLQVAWEGPAMPELMSSLPVSGVDGTMRRAKGALGRAHLKTGSLRDVVGIAGYVLSGSGRRYVVVALVNHPNANAGRPALDALVQWVAGDAAPRARASD
jgi:D-alanyl-D-alanine carboxypeptidase/D-alanyl-D-alanine-endopeptidase (penicillin-binding protein 4)